MKVEQVTFERNSSNIPNEDSSSWETIKQRVLIIKESSLTYFQDPLFIHFMLFILFSTIAIICILGIMFLTYRWSRRKLWQSFTDIDDRKWSQCDRHTHRTLIYGEINFVYLFIEYNLSVCFSKFKCKHKVSNESESNCKCN